MVASFRIFVLDVAVPGRAVILHLNPVLCSDIHPILEGRGLRLGGCFLIVTFFKITCLRCMNQVKHQRGKL